MNDMSYTGKKKRLPIEKIRSYVDYNPETGAITWKKVAYHTHNWRIGTDAGAAKGNGHVYVRIEKRDYMASRIAWILTAGVEPNGTVRFIDKNPSNLRWENLTLCETISGHDHNTAEGCQAYGVEWRKTFPRKAKENDLKKKFGITLRQYEDMFLAQKGLCAICNRRETVIRKGKELILSVDHDHETGHIRGLCCNACNNGLGQFKDNIEYLTNAISYLKKSRDTQKNDNVIQLHKEIPA